MEFLARFRQSDGYRNIAIVTYWGLAASIIIMLILYACGIMIGMGVLLGVIILGGVIMGVNVSIIIFCIQGIMDVVNKKPPTRQTDLIHDIGVVIAILGYLFFLCPALFFQSH